MDLRHSLGKKCVISPLVNKEGGDQKHIFRSTEEFATVSCFVLTPRVFWPFRLWTTTVVEGAGHHFITSGIHHSTPPTPYWQEQSHTEAASHTLQQFPRVGLLAWRLRAKET